MARSAQILSIVCEGNHLILFTDEVMAMDGMPAQGEYENSRASRLRGRRRIGSVS
jgi:hypothetical protein